MPANQPEAAPPDTQARRPAVSLRSRSYLMLLVLAAILGVPVSTAACTGFLALASYLQKEISRTLHTGLGFLPRTGMVAAASLGRGRRPAGRPGHPVPAAKGPQAAGQFMARRPGFVSRRRRGAGNPGLRCRAGPRDALVGGEETAWPCWPCTPPVPTQVQVAGWGASRPSPRCWDHPITGTSHCWRHPRPRQPDAGLVLQACWRRESARSSSSAWTT